MIIYKIRKRVYILGVCQVTAVSSKLLGPYRGLHKSIYIIFFARIINSMGNFVLPFLAIYLTDNLHMTRLDAGKFVMLYSALYVPGSMLGGKLCDNIGRKRTLIIFQAMAALCFLPCAYLPSTRLVPRLLIASGFFGGAAGPSHMAMVTDLTDGKNRKEAFSFLYLGNNIGFAAGPMIAGFLYRNHLPWIFIGDAFTTIISLALVALYVGETMPDKETIEVLHKDPKDCEKAEKGGLAAALLSRPTLLMFSIIMMIFSFVYAQYTFSLPIHVNSIFKGDGPKFYGMLMTVNALTVVLLTPLITDVTSKLSTTFSISLGGIQYALGYGMIYYISSMHALVISTIIWTIGEVLVTTNSGVYVANNTPISHRGRFNAVIPV